MANKMKVPYRRIQEEQDAPVASQTPAAAAPAGKPAKKKGKGLKIFGGVVLALVIVYAAIALWPAPQNFPLDNPMMKDGELPILIAHGGGNEEFPDNTLEGFYNAFSVDPDVMMETDVSITRDGVVILSHDTRIDRKTNATGYIIDWNYTDLIAQRVDFGYTNKTKSQVLVEGSELVPFTNPDGLRVTPLDVTYPEGVEPRDPEVFLATTLEELIVAFPNNRINVEIKQSGEEGLRCLAAIIELLDKHDAWDRVVLASFHNEIYAEYQRLQQEGLVPDTFMCSPGLGNAALFYVLQLVNADVFFMEGTCVLQLPTTYDIEIGGMELTINLATPGLIKAAHDHNLAVHYWTINDPDEMRMLIELGADGIMTDYPHRLAEVYAEYGAAE
ncbi:MAG: hypothetical protein IKK57_02710 [Clostridia bacterium]|nr:hypothetical protein [Clostridia bacterium]